MWVEKPRNPLPLSSVMMVVDSVAHFPIVVMLLANFECLLASSGIIENVGSSCGRKVENSHLLLQWWSFGGFTHGNVSR